MAARRPRASERIGVRKTYKLYVGGRLDFAFTNPSGGTRVLDGLDDRFPPVR
jgi:hypothetical protein